MMKGTKQTRQSLVGLGMTLAILLGTGFSASAQSIPPLTNPCSGVGGVLTFITNLLPFTLFGEPGYDCDVNPPETDSLL